MIFIVKNKVVQQLLSCTLNAIFLLSFNYLDYRCDQQVLLPCWQQFLHLTPVDFTLAEH